MRSKNRVSYDNKMLHYNADLELVDILCTSIDADALTPADNGSLFLHIENQKHPILSTWRICQENRSMAIYHLRQTVYGSYIKDMYEEFTHFLKNTIIEAVANLKTNPDRLIGEHKVSISANRVSYNVVSLSNYDPPIVAGFFMSKRR